MEFSDQARYHGYPVLTYTVTTKDGYKLGVHRIPGPKGEGIHESLFNSKGREAVLTSHGIDGTTQQLIACGTGKWVSQSYFEYGTLMGKAFPYQLVDTGKYDVWLMNQRGNFYSR